MELHERLASTNGNSSGAPAYDRFAEVKNRIHLGISEDLGRQIFNTEIDPDALRVRIADEVRNRLELERGLSREDRENLAGELPGDILGNGPIERLLADDSVS